MHNSFLFVQRDLEQDNGHFSVLVQRKSGLSVKMVHKEDGTKWQRRKCRHSQKADIQFSAPQVHCHVKAVGNDFCADEGTIDTVFCTIISVNQLSFYGAVEETCEEYESLHDRTGQSIVGGQSSSSFVPSVIQTGVLLDCDDFFSQRFFVLTQWRTN